LNTIKTLTPFVATTMLLGTLDSAIKLARNVEGVKSVENDVQLQ